MTEPYEKVTVLLLPEATLARLNAAELTGMTETDVVNAALITYNMMINAKRMGFAEFAASNGRETMLITIGDRTE